MLQLTLYKRLTDYDIVSLRPAAMAQTRIGFLGAAAPALPVVAPNDVPPLVPARLLSVAGSGKMEERRIGSRKFLLPCRLSGNESPQERALVFYAANAILETEC